MAKSEHSFQFSVVTPEKAVLEGDAESVTFPAHDGEIGILKGRAPLLCRLGIGPLKVRSGDGEKVLLIDGGFAQMVDNRLTILTEQAIDPLAIDRAAAAQHLDEARALKISDEKSFVDRQDALERARQQLKMARDGDLK